MNNPYKIGDIVIFKQGNRNEGIKATVTHAGEYQTELRLVEGSRPFIRLDGKLSDRCILRPQYLDLIELSIEPEGDSQ